MLRQVLTAAGNQPPLPQVGDEGCLVGRIAHRGWGPGACRVILVSKDPIRDLPIKSQLRNHWKFMISQWIPWASAASEDASPVSVPPAISLELAGKCCFSWLIGTVLRGATCSTARNPSSTAPSAGDRPPAALAAVGEWDKPPAPVAESMQHIAASRPSTEHTRSIPYLKRMGFPNLSKSPSYSLKIPILSQYLHGIYHLLPPVLVVYLWFI